MDRITREEVDRLSAPGDGPRVTIYAPMVRSRPEVRQNPVRLKNALGEAKGRLRERGYGDETVDRVLGVAASRLEDPEYWQHQSEGLAAFLEPAGARLFRLPVPFEQEVRVSEGLFALRPVLPLLEEDGRFTVLAVSGKDVRLFAGNRFVLDEVDLGEGPGSLEEAVRFDDPEKSVQHHTSERHAPSGRPAAVFHGHGAAPDAEEDRWRRYLQHVNRRVQRELAGDRAPMALAAVDSVRSMWRKTSDHPRILSEGIPGNPDEKDAEELHERAWRIVEPLFAKRREEDLERCRSLVDTDQTSADLEEVLSLAHQGRVETLAVSRNRHRWGRIDPDDGSLLEFEEEPAEGARELLDLAVARTLERGGRVHVVEPEELPEGADAVALLRF